MTLDEKRRECAWRMARSRLYDGENCTDVTSEFFELIYDPPCRPVVTWSGPECDDYLATHDDDGQHTDEIDRLLNPPEVTE